MEGIDIRTIFIATRCIYLIVEFINTIFYVKTPAFSHPSPINELCPHLGFVHLCQPRVIDCAFLALLHCFLSQATCMHSEHEMRSDVNARVGCYENGKATIEMKVSGSLCVYMLFKQINWWAQRTDVNKKQRTEKKYLVESEVNDWQFIHFLRYDTSYSQNRDRFHSVRIKP